MKNLLLSLFALNIFNIQVFTHSQFQLTIGGAGYDDAYSITNTLDGGYAVAGVSGSFFAGHYVFYIVKLTGSGSLQWTRTIGGTMFEEATSITQTADSGYVVAGQTNSFEAGDSDMYILKIDVSGTLITAKTFGATGREYAASIVQTTDGGYIVAGNTSSFPLGNPNMFIVKLDASGNTCANSTSPASIISSPIPTVTNSSPLVTSPSSISAAPTPTISSGGTVTTICVIGIQPISNEVPASFELFQNYPNPFNPNTRISFKFPVPSFATLKIYDVLGREIETLVNEQLKPGVYSVDWDGTNYNSGVYLYTLTTEGFKAAKQMILLK